MRHDLSFGLLPVRLLDQLDGFIEIEQGLKLITTQK
jgi:hypothetical protein